MNKRFGVSVYKEKFNFCSAHFLLFADGSRETLHGHNYRVWVDVDGPITDGDVVIDFMVLKPIVRRICDELDHRMLLPAESPFLRLERRDAQLWAHHADASFCFPEEDVLLLPIRNTSTERLAEYFCARLRRELEQALPGAELERVRVSVEESSGQCGYYEEQR